MLLRKINAGCSLMLTILLLIHTVYCTVWMVSGGSIAKGGAYMSWILVGLVVAHALISIDLAISSHTETEGPKGKHYLKQNIATIVQRMSGVFMILLIGLHIAGAENHFQSKALHGVIHPLFFGVVFAHVAVSTSKSLITLGIGTAKLVKIVDKITRILCAVTFIAAVAGFYLYLFKGAAV